MSKTVLFKTIQFGISTQFSSISAIDRTLSDATTPGQSGPGKMTMKGYSAFPKAPVLLDVSPECIVSNPDHLLGEF